MARRDRCNGGTTPTSQDPGYTPVVPTVLITDDNPDNRTVYSKLLRDTCEVQTADTGDAAIQAMSEEIDVIVLDRQMPGLSGEQVVEWLRDAGFDQPVIMVSAMDPDTTTLRLDIDTYLVKPVGANELRTTVHNVYLRYEYDRIMNDFFTQASTVSTTDQSGSTVTPDSKVEPDRAIDSLSAIKHQANEMVEIAINTGHSDDLFESLPTGASGPDLGCEFAHDCT